MYGRETLVDELTWDECWTHLRQERLGRLALGHGPSIELFPINYVADGQSIYLPTSPGTKSAMVSASPWVAFEIDGHDDGWTWSVVAKGPTRRVRSLADLDVLGQLVVPSASPGMKELYLRMDAVDVTGRRFRSAL